MTGEGIVIAIVVILVAILGLIMLVPVLFGFWPLLLLWQLGHPVWGFVALFVWWGMISR